MVHRGPPFTEVPVNTWAWFTDASAKLKLMELFNVIASYWTWSECDHFILTAPTNTSFD